MLPSLFRFFGLASPIQSVNGSSRTADCSNVSNVAGGTFICSTPASSALNDGNIPTLTGLDGNMWASQLLTLQPGQQGIVAFEFTSTPGYRGVSRVEVVMFNCPQYGISVRSILLLEAANVLNAGTLVAAVNPTVTSCDSLVRICISGSSIQPAVGLQFTVDVGSNWIHLAEVTFHDNGMTCPPDTVLTTSPILLNFLSPIQPTSITPGVFASTVSSDVSPEASTLAGKGAPAFEAACQCNGCILSSF